MDFGKEMARCGPIPKNSFLLNMKKRFLDFIPKNHPEKNNFGEEIFLLSHPPKNNPPQKKLFSTHNAIQRHKVFPKMN